MATLLRLFTKRNTMPAHEEPASGRIIDIEFNLGGRGGLSVLLLLTL